MPRREPKLKHKKYDFKFMDINARIIEFFSYFSIKRKGFFIDNYMKYSDFND